jgi:hypothetical protein
MVHPPVVEVILALQTVNMGLLRVKAAADTGRSTNLLSIQFFK